MNTALYWQNIYQEPDSNIGSILTGKNWLERHEPSQSREPPKPPSTENFPDQLPVNSKPVITPKKPAIPVQKPIIKPNSPPPISAKPKPAKINFQLKPLISEIQPKSSEEILPNLSKTNQQSEIGQPLAPITSHKEPPTAKEQILLQKIKQLEEQLRKTQTERNNLRIEKEQAKQSAQSEKQRADHYQQQLKTIVKTFKQWQKISYYQQLEREMYSAEQRTEIEAKIIQTPPSK